MFQRSLLCAILVVAVFLCSGAVAVQAQQCQERPPQPPGSVCDGQTNCLVDFAGYKWWTNYMFNLSGSGYWFNGQQWDPRLVYVDQNGLHLQLKMTQLPNAKLQWSSSEVVLWSDATGKRIYPGYGVYLVAASTNDSFDKLGMNGAFGAFTYREDEDNSQTNKHHELDMIEASRWGNPSDPTNAQFTLQPWQYIDTNVHRITIDKGVRDITLVMNWPGAGTAVTFAVYYGIYDFANLPPSPAISWKVTDPNNKVCVPTAACQTVHFNLWREPPGTVTPSGPQEVVIKKFQFRPIGTEAPAEK
jgi:hypothetical protein